MAVDYVHVSASRRAHFIESISFLPSDYEGMSSISKFWR